MAALLPMPFFLMELHPSSDNQCVPSQCASQRHILHNAKHYWLEVQSHGVAKIFQYTSPVLIPGSSLDRCSAILTSVMSSLGIRSVAHIMVKTIMRSHRKQ